MSALPSDAKERDQALSPADSFIVQAPAGSGKTELLTLRILSLLAVCEKPEEILAITFTRKAAAEMQNRVMEALKLGTEDKAPERTHDQLRWKLAKDVLRRDQQLNWQLTQYPNRLKIQTIDGFCRHLASRQPISSELGTLPDTISNNVLADQIILEAVRETLSQLVGNDELSTALKGLLSHFDNDLGRLEKLLLQLLNKREQWIFYLEQLNDDKMMQHNNQVLVETLLEEPHQALKPWQGDLVRFCNHSEENLQSDSLPLQTFPSTKTEDRENWTRVLKFLTTKGSDSKPGGIRSRVDKTMGVPTDSPLKAEIKQFFDGIKDDETLNTILIDAKQIPQHPISDEQLLLFKHMRIVLRDCLGRLILHFRQISATDYTEIALAALRALGDEDNPSDLSLKLEYRIKHILVDEFQDTSQLQLRLLERLTEGWSSEDNHSLFLVGDPMQSCYQFRNADVRIFLEVMEKGIGQIPITSLTLRENFRSAPEVVNWNNRAFTDAFPKQGHKNHSAVPYSPSMAFRTDLASDNNESMVKCFQINRDVSEDEAEDANAQEVRQVIELIKRIKGENPEDSIAVLVRTRSHASQLFAAMKAADIKWHGVDMNPLNENMVVMDLLCLTRALLNPGDHLSWLSLLRSPMIGLTLNDLHALCNVREHSDKNNFMPLLTAIKQYQQIRNLSEAGKQILARTVPIIQQALEQRGRKPLRIWIEGVWYALGGPAAANPEQQHSYRMYFEALNQHQHCGTISDWQAFEQTIEKLYDNTTEEETGNKKPKAVQVMTMHKAKGLEFDHVILPALANPPRNEDASMLLWNHYFISEDRPLLLFGAPLSSRQKGSKQKASSQNSSGKNDSLYTFLHAINKHKLNCEATRLLYVACTRAIKQLYLLASIKIKDDGKISAPDERSLLAAIWPTFKAEATTVDIESDENSVDKNGLEHIHRLIPDWQLPALAQNDLLQAWRGKSVSEIDESNEDSRRPRGQNIPDFTSRENFIARQTGTVIHRGLQLMAEQGLSQWSKDKIDQNKKYWHRLLLQQGLSNTVAEVAVNDVMEALKKTQDSEQGQWLLTVHQSSACELELLMDNKVSIIDRTFIDQDTRWIIDYKSSIPGSEISREQFIAEQSEKYRGQLQTYSDLFARKESLAVKTALYFPRLDHLEILN